MKTTVFLFLAFTLLIGAPQATSAQQSPISAESLALIWEQIAAQPGDVGIGCYPLNDPANAVLYNAAATFPLASVTKLLIFIEYARRLDAGEVTFAEVVDVAALDRYNLPRTDRGAHDRFMAQYPANVEQITLWELALGMIQYSSNAASDYLLDFLDPVDWASLYESLGITNTAAPHSLTMIPLLMNNHETGKATLDDLDALSIAQGERYLDLYVEDEAWRQAEIVYRSGRGSQFPEWEVQTDFLQRLTATGTVSDFVNVLRALYTDDDTLPENVKSMTRYAMLWTDSAFINEWYLEYDSKLGFYSGGTLTLVAYGDPFASDPVISVVFFRGIPRSQYTDLIEEDTIGNFAHWMNFNGCRGLSNRLP